jgi:hypothetical protein
MKMAYNDPRTKRLLDSGEGAKARAAFFFHDRGSEIQKSFEGLLRSTLHQILRALPSLLSINVPIYQQIANDKGLWSVNELQRAFNEVIIQKTTKADICLFLDALDEYSGSHDAIAKFLNGIVNAQQGAHTRIKICFSSWPLQIFLDRFQDTAGFDLRKWTASDIEIVINSRMRTNTRMLQYLQSPAPKDRSLPSQFADEIASKAEGVFLWVRLVLDELLEAFTDGENWESLMERLTDLPTELEEYYQRILKRLPPRYHTETLVMFNVLQGVGGSGLSLHDFVQICGYAEKSRLSECAPCDSKSLRWTNEELLRLIRGRGGGLIEAIPQDPQKYRPWCPAVPRESPLIVQLIHQTVKSFIQKPSTLGLLSNARSTASNCELSLVVKYILALTFQFATARDGPAVQNSHQWAIHIFSHARNIERSSKSYADLYEECGNARIAWLFSNETWVKDRGHPPLESLLSFSVAAGLPILLKELLDRNRPSKQLQIPLLHLAVHEHLARTVASGQIIRVLLEHGADLHVLHNGLTPFQLLWKQKYGSDDYMHDCTLEFLKFGQDPNQMIKYREESRQNGQPGERQASALHRAANSGHHASIKLLLEYNAHVNSLDSEGRTPLDIACNREPGSIWIWIKIFLDRPYDTRSFRRVVEQLEAVPTLLDNGVKRAHRPQPRSSIAGEEDGDHGEYDSGEDEKRLPITEDALQALSKHGIHADRRILDLPWLQPDKPSRSSQVFSMLSSPFRSGWLSRS